ncbi:MAG: NAD(P)-binding domain-containing protein, partial [Actinomycetes bacterium]
MDIGVLHPGDMGAAIGRILVQAGHTVRWSAADRSPATAERAAAAGLIPVDGPLELASSSALLISVCPPHAAVDVARSVSGFAGVYLDANAVSPDTARRVAA